MSASPVSAQHLMGAAGLRSTFGLFATGVVIVTAPRMGGGWVAVTVNSFASVSLVPPLVLWCLGRTANCLEHFERADRFAINVLRHDQQKLSTMLARPSACNWMEVAMRRSARGHGLIPGALATFECAKRSRFEAGDHLVMIGEVEAFASGAVGGPLAFFRGGYGSFTADQTGEYQPMSADSGEGVQITLGWG